MFTPLVMKLLSTSVRLWNQVIVSGAGKPVASHDKKKASNKVGLCAKGFSTKAGPAVDDIANIINILYTSCLCLSDNIVLSTAVMPIGMQSQTKGWADIQAIAHRVYS